MVKKPNKKIVYIVTGSAVIFTAIVIVVAVNYHFESINHDSGPINRLLNIKTIDDDATILMHTKKGIIAGELTEINDNFIKVKNNNIQWLVTTDDKTKYRAADLELIKQQLQKYDQVTVLGDVETGTTSIRAVLIRKY
jgi:hypothetical protein